MKIESTVDRIEGKYAVLELDQNHFIEFPLSSLPADVREGSKIIIEITVDQTA